jgi:hypothetical protein
MRSSSSWRRVRVERGIYLLPNGKHAVLRRRAGRQWLECFEANVAAGERHARTLESHRYHLERHLLPALATKRLSALTVDDVAALLGELRAKGCSAKTAAGALATRQRLGLRHLARHAVRTPKRRSTLPDPRHRARRAQR